MAGKERRILETRAELRVSSDGRHLEGYGIVFDSLSQDLGGFRERIDPGVEIAYSNLVATFNHDPDQLLGREASGTLEVERSSRGVAYRIDIPDTQTGRDLRELVRRGDVSGSSFTFDVGEDGAELVIRGAERLRTIRKMTVFEMGPVVFPAYPDTSVALRSLEKAPPVPAGYREVVARKLRRYALRGYGR